jgi:hypothetical protein
MKRALWILRGNLKARVGWFRESGQGVYFGHLGDLPEMHYSYHTEGRKHVALPHGVHFPPRGTQDTPLDDVAGRKGIGGFSIDPFKLPWTVAGKFGRADLIFSIDREARDDIPFLVSAYILPHGEATIFAAEAHSAGAYKDACVTLRLAEFSHLTCVAMLQYMVREGGVAASAAV